jgi:mRNA interferase MazF
LKRIRQDLLDSKANRVLRAPINTSGFGLSTEVQIGVDEGLKHDSVINCDQITRLEKGMDRPQSLIQIDSLPLDP